LSAAHDVGQLVRIRCLHCRLTRNYLPDDLNRLIGDIEIDRLEQRMRCQKCHLTDYIQVTLWFPTAEERQHLTVRRLVKIKTHRIPVWRDERS
jgi:hypothetical protein